MLLVDVVLVSGSILFLITVILAIIFEKKARGKIYSDFYCSEKSHNPDKDFESEVHTQEGWFTDGEGYYLEVQHEDTYSFLDRYGYAYLVYKADKNLGVRFQEKMTIIDTKKETFGSYKDYSKERFSQPCESPFKIHWDWILHAEMLEKKRKEVSCHAYVDEILDKQIEYNDLQFKYEMKPSAPIRDIESFKNFCCLVSDVRNFPDYDIQNYLLLKLENQRKS